MAFSALTSKFALRRQLRKRYRTRISPAVKELIRKIPGQNAEALRKQFYPSVIELAEVDGFTGDPLREEDRDIHPHGNLVHKYANKVLVLTTNECPVYCRYCTRKRKTLMGSGGKLDPAGIADYLQSQSQVNEIIYSGGDPFMLPDSELTALVEATALPQIRFLRYHTRTLTTLPRRFAEKTVKALATLTSKFPDKQHAIVAHANTAAELTPTTAALVKKLKAAGYRLYCQSVLLRGVNDDAQTLRDLVMQLLESDIQPYYLHQLDAVEGSSHFEVPLERGRQIMEELRQLVPPYALPRYVIDSKEGKNGLYY